MSVTLLEASSLHISFGGVTAADGIDLEVFSGERLAIIGPNGAGKTTFLNICTGYLTPSAGSVRFGGRDITAMAPRAITRMGIARAFQSPQLFHEQCVIDNLLLAAAARERAWNPFRPLRERPEHDEMLALLELFGLADHAASMVNELPEGTRKLVDIAVALALRPQLLLMDEPTSGVSSLEKFRIMDLLVKALAEQGVTSVFVEHDMEMVERYADRVAVWNSGRIQSVGAPDQVLADPSVMRDVIGV
ncbi:MAG: ABC transporter ATP-binding protein [Rhodospirillales bacterium]|nr:ABC transporter ATP-binding protein [Rhodospirillales bacterium]MCY3855737.1 ABC transporter ATP-binding protein [Rhodospirillales bacterium]MCY4003940.1 ABC transporter ATP-binding protein [Rhodospirillales bacterium]MXX21758.1 ABC transporter ATP-binding protein [Rhodospirillales bacterium]